MKEEIKNKETMLYPIFGYGIGISYESYKDWMNNLVYDLIQMGKINSDNYENLENYRVPYVPLKDILKACEIDPKLDLYVLDTECFNEYYSDKGCYVWINDDVFDETFSTIEKKNIVLTVFDTMGLIDLTLKNINTFLDIVEFEKVPQD